MDVYNLRFSFSGWFWVDASDIGQQPGHFAWSDGRKVNNTFSNFWYSGEPNNFGTGKETCVFLSADSGKLRDEPCSHSRAIICELAACPVSEF